MRREGFDAGGVCVFEEHEEGVACVEDLLSHLSAEVVHGLGRRVRRDGRGTRVSVFNHHRAKGVDALRKEGGQLK